VKNRNATRDLIVEDLKTHGPSTSQQIAERTGLRAMQVSNTMIWARGGGLVNDGSTIYDWPDGMGCMHRPKGPVVWAIGDTPRVKGRCPDQFPDDYNVAMRANAENEVRVRHNHFTRDIKAPGVCPACDARRMFAPVSETEED